MVAGILKYATLGHRKIKSYCKIFLLHPVVSVPFTSLLSADPVCYNAQSFVQNCFVSRNYTFWCMT